MFLNNTRKVIKTTPDNKYDLVLYISDEIECKAIEEKTFIPNVEIYASGETKDAPEAFAALVLPTPRFIENLLTNSTCDSYKCFCCENLGLDQMISHNTARASWDCLMNVLGNPEYVVITREKHAEDTTI